MGAGVARVVPDVTGLDKQFDYLVPASLAHVVRPGSLVRVPLHGRRVGGWVVAVDPPTDVPVERLAMLAAKSTCKDRWRQILAEADRLPVKHLLTLEPGISAAQTNEMAARNVVLVIPLEIHGTFSAGQRPQILTVRAFIERLRNQQFWR